MVGHRVHAFGTDPAPGALWEAELVSRVLDRFEFSGWLERFLPGLARGRPEGLFYPAEVSDPTDGMPKHRSRTSRAATT